MKWYVIALLASLAACTTTEGHHPPCASAGAGPCGLERPANNAWQS